VGLYFYKARVYDPMTGRFLQNDPIGYESDLNMYAYTRGDPVNRSDPSGMATDDDNKKQEESDDGGGHVFGSSWNLNTLPLAHEAELMKAAADAMLKSALQQSADAVANLGEKTATQLATPLIGRGFALVAGPLAGVAASFIPSPTAGPQMDETQRNYIVRGGTCFAAQFCSGSGVVAAPNGQLSGVSVQAYPNTSVQQLSQRQWVPNSQIGVTTFGAAQAAGATLVPDPRPGNPYHAIMGGLTGAQFEGLFQVMPNPNPKLKQ